MSLGIRSATGDDDLAAIVDLQNAITPDDPTSIEELRWADATYPGGTRLLAELDGRPVGTASVGRIYVYPPEHPNLWVTIVVTPEVRGQGIGSALLEAVSAVARDAGKTGLEARVSAGRPDALAFALHRGFVEEERSKTVRLELDGVPRPATDLPAGLVLSDLAREPGRVAQVHEVALEAFPDIPGGTEPMAVGDLAEFRARDVDRPGIPPDAFMLAIDPAADTVVGYASLMFVPGSRTVAWHDMTAVRRAWRGRGIAGALKRATIAWAIDHGLTALETGNDEGNAGMRAVNARLGYAPLPDEVFLAGPLAPASDERADPATSAPTPDRG